MKKEHEEGKRNGDMSETTGKKPAVKKKVRRKGKRRVSLRRRILTILAILMPAALIAGVILYFLVFRENAGKEITEEWLYHLGVPTDKIEELAENSAVCVPTMMPYITAFFMPRTKGDRPDVIPDGCVNFAFLGQFAETPRDTVFTTEYSVRTAMEAVYGLLGVDRGVPEVWGSVYDIRELLDSSVKLMDGKSPLEIQLPGPLNALKKPVIKVVKGTVIEKLLRDHGILTEDM